MIGNNMKKLICSVLITSQLLLATGCDPDEAATAVAISGALIYVARIDNSSYIVRNKYYYYQTQSCQSYFYYDTLGSPYYPRDCLMQNGRYYVTFGTVALLTALLIYR
jgi:hypothetical protein